MNLFDPRDTPINIANLLEVHPIDGGSSFSPEMTELKFEHDCRHKHFFDLKATCVLAHVDVHRASDAQPTTDKIKNYHSSNVHNDSRKQE